ISFQIWVSFFSLAPVLVPWMESTPTSSVVKPQTARARRSGATRGSDPSSMPNTASASFSCLAASFSMLSTRAASSSSVNSAPSCLRNSISSCSW
ncbi:hypothetical protein EV122DRAFT_258313, partial [Schizophyllum commune]